MSEQDFMKKRVEELRGHFAQKNLLKCLTTIEIIAEYFDASLTEAEIGKFR